MRWESSAFVLAVVLVSTHASADPLQKSDDIVKYMNQVKGWPGIYGTVTWTPEQHNGFPDSEVVMCEVNSLKDGAFNLAPGYSA